MLFSTGCHFPVQRADTDGAGLQCLSNSCICSTERKKRQADRLLQLFQNCLADLLSNFPSGPDITAVAPQLQESVDNSPGHILPVTACPPCCNKDPCCACTQEIQLQEEPNFLNLKCLHKIKHFLGTQMNRGKSVLGLQLHHITPFMMVMESAANS